MAKAVSFFVCSRFMWLETKKKGAQINNPVEIVFTNEELF